jgi:hypothetical protein
VSNKSFSGIQHPLSQRGCLFIRDYSATSTETVTGNTSPDRTHELHQAASENLPVASVSTEPHGIAPDFLGEVALLRLDTDRLQLERYMSFLEKYGELVGVEDDLRYLSVGIDARISVQDLKAVLMVEVSFQSGHSERRVRETLQQWQESMPWIVEYDLVDSQTGVIRHSGGPNDLVTTQILELVKGLKKQKDAGATITCTFFE